LRAPAEQQAQEQIGWDDQLAAGGGRHRAASRLSVIAPMAVSVSRPKSDALPTSSSHCAGQLPGT
jgi:hypothetical protein